MNLEMLMLFFVDVVDVDDAVLDDDVVVRIVVAVVDISIRCVC